MNEGLGVVPDVDSEDPEEEEAPVDAELSDDEQDTSASVSAALNDASPIPYSANANTLFMTALRLCCSA